MSWFIWVFIWISSICSPIYILNTFTLFYISFVFLILLIYILIPRLNITLHANLNKTQCLSWEYWLWNDVINAFICSKLRCILSYKHLFFSTRNHFLKMIFSKFIGFLRILVLINLYIKQNGVSVITFTKLFNLFRTHDISNLITDLRFVIPIYTFLQFCFCFVIAIVFCKTQVEMYVFICIYGHWPT